MNANPSFRKFAIKPPLLLQVLTFAFITFLFACKKDESESPIPIHVFKGKVIQKYTKEVIPNAVVQIYQVDRYGNQSPTNLQTVTNNLGEFTFKSSVELPGNAIRAWHPAVFDSTQKIWQVHPSYPLYTSLSPITTIELEPSGLISFFIADSTWTNLSLDSLLIESPYTRLTSPIVKNLTFYVEPYKTHAFFITAYSGGQIIKNTVKYIYAPNYYPSKSVSNIINYTINFP